MAVAIFRTFSCSPALVRPRRNERASKLAAFSAKLVAPSSLSHSKKKVLVPIGLGTEVMEAVILVDVLRRAGAKVVIASVESELAVEASSGVKLVADRCISDCANELFDLVALPGGMPGSARLRDCEILRMITTKQAEDKRLYGAICAAPAVALMSWGLIKHKKVSGELTTSRGPGTAFEFALSFVQQLFGDNVADNVGKLLLMQLDGKRHKKEEFNAVEWTFDRTPCALVPIANGSEEMEVAVLVDILRRAKVDVVIASVEKSLQVVASQRTKILADKSIADVSESTFDLIILPGGAAGAERLGRSKFLKKLLKEQKESGRVYGGICSSPVILQEQGLLKEKIATAHPSAVNKLTGQATDRADIVIDGNLITCKGLETVIEFSMAIIHKLFGHGRARSLAEGIVFEYEVK